MGSRTTALLARDFPLMLPTSSLHAYHGFLEVAVRSALGFWPPPHASPHATPVWGPTEVTTLCCHLLPRTVPIGRTSSG